MNYRELLLAAIVTLAVSHAKAQIVLTVDRDTGAVAIRSDETTASVNIDGYQVVSPNGLLSAAGWSSFASNLIAGWEETPGASANGVAEFNPQVGGFVTLQPGVMAGLGNAYTLDVSAAMAAVGFGNDFEDLAFSYSDDTANSLVAAAVEYTGTPRFNNLVVDIDTVTGQATLTNESSLPVDIDFYQLTSPDEVLDTGFGGLAQTGSPVAGWETGAATTTGLAQFFPQPASGFTVAAGATFDLGSAFTPGAASRDVEFLFRIVGGDDTGFAGEVRFAELLDGDFNADGVVNAADYTVWRDNLNGDESLINNVGDGSGTIDQGDYDVWSANYGRTNAAAGAATAVPEPSSLAAAALLLLGARWVAPRQKKERS